MAYLFDRQWSRAELLSYMGDLSQLAGIRLARWDEGVERGVRVAEVRTGAGLDFTVLLDRGMDIGPAAYRGLPLAWLSPAGFAHPAYFEPEGLGWLRTFGGGLLTGCGLTYLGAPDEDEGQALGLHGRLSLLPARHVQVGEAWEGDECSFWVQGEMREARLFGENLRLTRRIIAWLGQTRLAIEDRVENLGATPSPLMILYHINLGFPLLDETCELLAEPHAVRPRDSVAAPGLETWMRFQPPTPGYREQVFYHDLPADAEGWASITLRNPTRRLSLTVRYQKAMLPNLVQWKMMGEGAYVLGLEPANCRVEGRSKERARGTLQFLAPGEQRDFRVEIAVSV
ncbi:MAG: aldose 1-epimerase family protein [Anaerolineae bacterium]|nr:aldose 1-epimerase family protein [Anaerolineae bacterium]